MHTDKTDTNNHENTNDWLEIQLETTDQFNAETLEDALFASGALSVTLTSKMDEVILIEPNPGELPLWEEGIIATGLYDKGVSFDSVLPLLSELLGTEKLPLVGTHALADREWALEWTKHFKPIVFGEHLWICPSNQHVPSEKITSDTQIITLDPGLAFGTGTHPTTAMALTTIASTPLRGQHVIDFGCGSGVLGIAARKMGAKAVVMTDIDPQALKTAQENATINQVDDAMQYYLPDAMPEMTTDFLIANILLEPLLNLKDTFVRYCHNDTRILLTGLLRHQVPEIIACYESDFCDFTLTHSEDWSMVIAKKSPYS